MAPRSSVTARKAPMQQRSRETVRRILDAATRVLKERGYEGFSTNRIALAAGISPGSLYQYFANKDAILNAMVAEYTEQLLHRVSSNLDKHMYYDAAGLVSAAVATQVDAMLEQPEMLQVIAGQMPGTTGAELLRPIEGLIGEIIRGYTLASADRPTDMDVEAASWLMIQLLGTTIRYVLDKPPIAKDVFIKEMTRIAQCHPMGKARALAAS
ncbi:hypothetical protein AWC27_07410 [Mycobacterium szulgai]|uniref:HTH tetR-type domain-containing protein n=1 Tax=Mycobacterium szulgai TaxID=1787 RepID=A0A1X2E2G5_MYCSZ|nr:TetR/AcrR family transcriptional regulator [Mycobacterium szulgai]ORW94520.1 hypothetical protein AWC27_07410 [Mycobacterium szulgai]